MTASGSGPPLYSMTGMQLRRSSAHQREIPALPLTRRGFLRSLSRTALVLPLEDVLRLARPVFGLGSRQIAQSPPATGNERMAYEAQARPAPKGAPSPVTRTAGWIFSW